MFAHIEIQLSPAESEQLLIWEFVAAENYVYESTVREAETQDERVKQILQRFVMYFRQILLFHRSSYSVKSLEVACAPYFIIATLKSKIFPRLLIDFRRDCNAAARNYSVVPGYSKIFPFCPRKVE